MSMGDVKIEIIEVFGPPQFAYTNPGGFVTYQEESYLVVERIHRETHLKYHYDRFLSDIVLLRQLHPQKLRFIDEDRVLLAADIERKISYTRPRVIKNHNGIAFNMYTDAAALVCRPWLYIFENGLTKKTIPLGFYTWPSQDAYIFQAHDGSIVLLNTLEKTKNIHFYCFRDRVSALLACNRQLELHWWYKHLVGQVVVPKWFRGKQGPFNTAFFGTLVHSKLALIMLERISGAGVYSVLALQPLADNGTPLDFPKIIVEPDVNLPSGLFPSTIYCASCSISSDKLSFFAGLDTDWMIHGTCKLGK